MRVNCSECLSVSVPSTVAAHLHASPVAGSCACILRAANAQLAGVKFGPKDPAFPKWRVPRSLLNLVPSCSPRDMKPADCLCLTSHLDVDPSSYPELLLENLKTRCFLFHTLILLFLELCIKGKTIFKTTACSKVITHEIRNI